MGVVSVAPLSDLITIEAVEISAGNSAECFLCQIINVSEWISSFLSLYQPLYFTLQVNHLAEVINGMQNKNVEKAVFHMMAYLLDEISHVKKTEQTKVALAKTNVLRVIVGKCFYGISCLVLK